MTVLGVSGYAMYLGRFILNFPKVMRAGDLSPLDKSMGSSAKTFHYRGKTFKFDCQFCDDSLNEGSFGFGIVREMYIRDCYFRWQPKWVYERARTVVDLGANRGAFSTLMTTQANKIVSVECGNEYPKIITHNLSINNFKGYSALETAFIGEGGTTESDSDMMSIDELFDRHELDQIDFLKMDIEGSEFSLFKNADWLTRVKAVSMEVHPDCGDPKTIVAQLEEAGFSCKAADENLIPLTEIQRDLHWQSHHPSFLYAWKDSEGSHAE